MICNYYKSNIYKKLYIIVVTIWWNELVYQIIMFTKSGIIIVILYIN